MASVKITTEGFYSECGEPGCCSDYWTDWALHIDGALVAEGSTGDPYGAELEAAKAAFKYLGHTVDINELETKAIAELEEEKD